MTRRHLTPKIRLAIFTAHDGLCEFCGGKIHVGEAWDISHTIPLEMGGADDETNMRPAHRKCHRVHTATVDAPQIAKVKRIAAKHSGAWPRSRARIPSRKFASTRASHD